MTKTHDEIKKGLEEEIPVHYHIDGEPRLTPRLLMDMQWLHKDAIALIQQLQAENAEKDARIQQLEAERDAAVADILYAASVYLGECNTCKNGEVCAACKRQDACDECPNSKCMCSGCGAGRSNWQWRGVQKEDSTC